MCVETVKIMRSTKDPVTWLYPPSEPKRSGMLAVSDGHQIYFEEYGNLESETVVCVLHGGPGGGSQPGLARYFDPRVWRIVQHDQRGCGKSLPHVGLENNTTAHLVQDIEALRAHLTIPKWHVFGGSWGSTLALAYSQSFPQVCRSLMLRGIFALRKREIHWFYQDGASLIFPEAWALYRDHIPEAERGDFVAAYHRRLMGPDPEARQAAARVWSVWEGSTSRLIPGDVSRFAEDKFALQFASIENHYFSNGGFFPRDGYLLEDEQVKKLAGIPTTIVQGRYDVVCPIETAHILFEKLKHVADVDFIVVPDAGHSLSEPGIAKALVAASDRYALLK